MKASSPLVARAEELYLAYEMDGLPAALRRNSIDYYYLSVYPGLAEMADLEESDLPSYPETLRDAYVHIPFCSGLCSFCSYFLTTVKAGQDAPIHAYLELVKQELAFHQEHATIDLSVVYFGGGTPSLIPPAMLAELFDFMTDRRILASGRRYGTVELHPEFFADLDAAQEFVDVLRANGITRVSVGLESADPGILDGANRRHDGSFLSEAMGFLRGNGLHVNLDLMYGMPGLSAASWEESLRTSTASEPDSISAYFLFLDRGTALRTDVDRGKVALPTHREIQVQHLMAQLHLAESGYHELPNDFYAKISVDPATFTVDKLPSAAASLPVGPGAYGFFDGMQFANVFSFAEYRARLARHQSPMWRGHRFAPDDLMRRDVMFAFKNSPYLDHRLFQDAYGIPPVAAFPDVFEVLHRLGLVDVSDSAGRSTLTGKGRLCVEEIACLLRSSALTRIDAVGAGTPATVAASRSAAAATRELRLLRKHHFAPTYPALGKRPASGGKIS